MIIAEERSALEHQAARLLATSLQRAVDERGRAICGVPGGRSVAAILQLLAGEAVDLSRVHFFMVDERLVPPDHPDSNFRLVASCLSTRAAPDNLHPFPWDAEGSSTSLDTALNSYNRLFEDHGGRFDVVLLSSGEDGHVASLFPNHPSIYSDEPLFIMTEDAPKPPPARISASRRLLTSARTALLLFFGEEKRHAFDLFKKEETSIEHCPAKLVSKIPESYVLTDGGE